jgi:hypothetical protein
MLFYLSSNLALKPKKAEKAYDHVVSDDISRNIEIQKPEFLELTLIQSYKELFLSIPETGRKFRRGR